MTVQHVSVEQLHCDHADDNGRCPIMLSVDAGATSDAVRQHAAERGWVSGGEGDRCPKHRGAA